MGEPCSAIDPVATAAVEDQIHRLKRGLTIVIITHNLAQARRRADRVAFFHIGRRICCSTTQARPKLGAFWRASSADAPTRRAGIYIV